MNSDLENSRVSNALKLIATKYAKYLPFTGYHAEFFQALMAGKNIDLYVKFQDQSVFNVTASMSKVTVVRGNCRTTAFTCSRLTKLDEREIYINRDTANPTTVIHELFHFFTSPKFDKQVPPSITEAVTEYFTRKALSQKAAQQTNYAEFTLDGRKGRYDAHHDLLTFGRGGAKKAPDHSKDYMKRAYFGGEQEAITFLMTHLGALDEILKSETE